MRRATVVEQENINCADKRMNYASMEAFNRSAVKSEIQGYLDEIGGLTGARVEQLKNSREPGDNTMYLRAIQNLQLAENLTNLYIGCINKDIIKRNDYSSRLYTLQQEIEATRKEVQEKKETAKEAKERASDLQDPYSKTTWWETWFPLGRPIRKENVPVLLSVSIVMLILSLGVFLRFAGFELRLDSLQQSTTTFLKNVNARKYP